MYIHFVQYLELTVDVVRSAIACVLGHFPGISTDAVGVLEMTSFTVIVDVVEYISCPCTTDEHMLIFNKICVMSWFVQMGRYESSYGDETFTALDYVAATPDWSVMGHPQQGFDPMEIRWHRKTKKDIGGC